MWHFARKKRGSSDAKGEHPKRDKDAQKRGLVSRMLAAIAAPRAASMSLAIISRNPKG